MRVWVAFIWTDKRKVNGQWHWETQKRWASQWARATAKMRGFEHYEIFGNMSEIRRYVFDADCENLDRAFASFKNYASGTQKDLFEDR